MDVQLFLLLNLALEKTSEVRCYK